MSNQEELLTHKQNVVLFPKTYEYYQMELTRMLEAERYKEALELLELLLQFKGENEEIVQEWQALYGWLQFICPENDQTGEEAGNSFNMADHDAAIEMESEEELLHAHTVKKLQMDEHYGQRLLDSLRDAQMDERSWFVMEQLVSVDDPQLDDAIIHTLEMEDLHPLIQFGLLQTLSRRQVKGKVMFCRGDEQVSIQIEDTPLDYNSFPQVLQIPTEQINEAVAVREPSLAYFAQEIWQQFLRAIYGSTLYDQLKSSNSSNINVWAAALHGLVAGYLNLEENEAEVLRTYRVHPEQRVSYELALRELSKSRSRK